MKALSVGILCLAVTNQALAQQANPPSIIPQLKLPEQLNETFREMMEDLKPTLDETFRLMDSFGTIGDPRHYHLPEVLPNGDIILRRKDDAPPVEPEAPEAKPEADKGVRT